ncbi:hypothetical protein LTR95_007924 [Oleoguttula sp. CCFEE 5521]
MVVIIKKGTASAAPPPPSRANNSAPSRFHPNNGGALRTHVRLLPMKFKGLKKTKDMTPQEIAQLSGKCDSYCEAGHSTGSNDCVFNSAHRGRYEFSADVNRETYLNGKTLNNHGIVAVAEGRIIEAASEHEQEQGNGQPVPMSWHEGFT